MGPPPQWGDPSSQSDQTELSEAQLDWGKDTALLLRHASGCLFLSFKLTGRPLFPTGALVASASRRSLGLRTSPPLGAGSLTEDRTLTVPGCRSRLPQAPDGFDLLALSPFLRAEVLFSWLGNPTDCVVYGVSKSWAQPSDSPQFLQAQPPWVMEDWCGPWHRSCSPEVWEPGRWVPGWGNRDSGGWAEGLRGQSPFTSMCLREKKVFMILPKASLPPPAPSLSMPRMPPDTQPERAGTHLLFLLAGVRGSSSLIHLFLKPGIGLSVTCWTLGSLGSLGSGGRWRSGYGTC